MRILITLLCFVAVSCNERRSPASYEVTQITGADAVWASENNIFKSNIARLVDWPVHAVGIVVIGDDGSILKELHPIQSPQGETFSPDTVIRLAVSREDTVVKCRLGVGGFTTDKRIENEFAPFGGWTGGSSAVDGIVIVTTDGDLISMDGDVMMNSPGKKLGFKLYRHDPTIEKANKSEQATPRKLSD